MDASMYMGHLENESIEMVAEADFHFKKESSLNVKEIRIFPAENFRKKRIGAACEAEEIL